MTNLEKNQKKESFLIPINNMMKLTPINYINFLCLEKNLVILEELDGNDSQHHRLILLLQKNFRLFNFACLY